MYRKQSARGAPEIISRTGQIVRGQPTARDRTGAHRGQQWRPDRRARLHWGGEKTSPRQRWKPRPLDLLTK
eukprot:1839056-Prymnesium_polylepis.1